MVIQNIDGSQVAIISGEDVYGNDEQHLGTFNNRLFLDHDGGVVALISGADGEIRLPVPSIPLIPSITPGGAMLTMPTIPTLPSLPSRVTLSWGKSWDEFIAG